MRKENIYHRNEREAEFYIEKRWKLESQREYEEMREMKRMKRKNKLLVTVGEK